MNLKLYLQLFKVSPNPKWDTFLLCTPTLSRVSIALTIVVVWKLRSNAFTKVHNVEAV